MPQKRNSMYFLKAEVFLCKILFAVFSLHLVLCYNPPEEDIHPDASSLPEMSKWALVEEFPATPGIFALTRLGRKLVLIPQTLIPYPRAGRELDFDGPLFHEAFWNNLEYPLIDAGLDSKVQNFKRGRIGLTPRVGRKKRSADEEDSEEDARSKALSRFLDGQDWSEDLESGLFLRPDRGPNKNRISLVPRIGKKRSGDVRDEIEKRAMALTPRIGRAALVPRIGRNDNRFQVSSRASFIPRLGRRAALTPRIGRSDRSREDTEKTK